MRNRIRDESGHRRVVVAAAAGVVALFGLTASPIRGAAGPTTPTFGYDYVSTTLAGGEPFVIYSHAGKDLVYAAHEGTTHLDRNGVPQADSSCDILPPGTPPSGFICEPYDNHINQWYSTDGGQTWTLESTVENPLALTDVATHTGFSDPSLTEDAPDTSPSHNPQNIYDTGIDLANDALYGSSDGGKSFPFGTPQCTEGDRPWLAGGHNGEVFLATDLELPALNGAQGHAYFHGRVEGPAIVCNQNAIQDHHGGDAQDYYDHHTGDIYEGALFSDGGVGLGTLEDASHAWGSTPTDTSMPTGAFSDSEGVNCGSPLAQAQKLCTQLGPILPEIAVDNGDTVYVVWATGPYSSSKGNGCSSATAAGGNAIEPNSIYMVHTSDEGAHWSTPVPIATPATTGGTNAIWPFAVAGAAGNVSVAWYQSNQLTDPDCDSAALLPGGKPTKWTIQVANIFNANSAGTTYPPTSVDAVPADTLHPGGVMHVGGICQSGTTCVATGQDRRLGDYFTSALDPHGCVMIASGDTMRTDTLTGGQLDLSRPIFLQQASGQSLTNPRYQCTSKLSTGPGSNVPEAPGMTLLLTTGGGAVVGFTLWSRRRKMRRI